MRLLKTFAGQAGVGFLMGLATAPGIFFWFGWEAIVVLLLWFAAAALTTSVLGVTGWGAMVAGLVLMASAYGLLRGAYFTVGEVRVRSYR